jgi:hypothetical protein
MPDLNKLAFLFVASGVPASFAYHFDRRRNFCDPICAQDRPPTQITASDGGFEPHIREAWGNPNCWCPPSAFLFGRSKFCDEVQRSAEDRGNLSLSMIRRVRAKLLERFRID